LNEKFPDLDWREINKKVSYNWEQIKKKNQEELRIYEDLAMKDKERFFSESD